MRDRAFVVLVAVVVILSVALLTQTNLKADAPEVGRYQMAPSGQYPYVYFVDTATGCLWVKEDNNRDNPWHQIKSPVH